MIVVTRTCAYACVRPRENKRLSVAVSPRRFSGIDEITLTKGFQSL
jgi:hypothetical protein